jgi:hypothetical protein
MYGARRYPIQSARRDPDELVATIVAEAGARGADRIPAAPVGRQAGTPEPVGLAVLAGNQRWPRVEMATKMASLLGHLSSIPYTTTYTLF